MAFVAGKGKLSLNGIHFTMDFIVTDSDDALFLEGGPPHELGAHECCFREGAVEGLALADGVYHSHLEPSPCLVGYTPASRRHESELRYAGTFSELPNNDHEVNFYRDEFYEDIMRTAGETC